MNGVDSGFSQQCLWSNAVRFVRTRMRKNIGGRRSCCHRLDILDFLDSPPNAGYDS